MKWKSLLVTLSVALNVGLIVTLVAPSSETVITLPAAFAQNRAVAGGGLAATTAAVSSTRQALYIVDNREKRMNVYVFSSSGKGNLKAIGTVDLRSDKAFGPGLAGDVMLLPGGISSTTEAVYVIDPVGRKLIVFASKGKKLEVIGATDLGKDFTGP